MSHPAADPRVRAEPIEPHTQLSSSDSSDPKAADDFGPLAYQRDTYKHGLRYERPTYTFDNTQWQPRAFAVLSAEARGYLSSAGRHETHDKNLAAFARWSIVPRQLTGPCDRPYADTSVTVFDSAKKGPGPEGAEKNGEDHGQNGSNGVSGPQSDGKPKSVWDKRLPYPFALAPVGVLQIFHPDGESGTARAAAATGVPYILSTASSTSIEDVAAASGPGAERWFQLYWPRNEHDAITNSVLSRAKAAGFSALVVTLDAYALGWRTADLDNGYNPFLRADKVGVAIGFSDPVFRRHFQQRTGKEVEEDMALAAGAWCQIAFPGVPHAWEDLARLRGMWGDGPIVLKGIQSVADARRAADTPGVSAIVVSNHGGRQQEGGPASLAMLPRIVKEVGHRLEVWFDSGVRSGTDVMKAYALGARFVLVGRPFVYGLAMGGQGGVEHVVKAFQGELALNLHLSGLKRLEDLSDEQLVREDDLY